MITVTNNQILDRLNVVLLDINQSVTQYINIIYDTIQGSCKNEQIWTNT